MLVIANCCHLYQLSTGLRDSLQTIDTMTGEVVRISDAQAGISATVRGLGAGLRRVNRSMGVIDGPVFHMAGNVQPFDGGMHRRSGPMGFVNSMMPW